MNIFKIGCSQVFLCVIDFKKNKREAHMMWSFFRKCEKYRLATLLKKYLPRMTSYGFFDIFLTATCHINSRLLFVFGELMSFKKIIFKSPFKQISEASISVYFNKLL